MTTRKVFMPKQYQFNEGQETQDQFYPLAGELRHTRTSVLTGAEKKKQMVTQVLAIRSGKAHRPVCYSSVNWGLVDRV